MDDSLFPELPEDLTELSDEDLDALLEEHQVALGKIENEDPEYVGGLTGPDVIAALEVGVDQIKTIKDEKHNRVEAQVAYSARKAELLSLAKGSEEVLSEESAEEDAEGDGDEGEAVAAEPEEAAAEEEVVEEEPVVVAAAEPARTYRRAPLPVTSPERTPMAKSERTVLVAAAGADGVTPGVELDRIGLANAMVEHVKRRARPSKHANGTEERTLIASAHYNFPPERVLRPNDIEGNNSKIRAIGNPFLGVEGINSLVASGGLCAPLTPLYEIPDFAVTDRPVRDALPSFQAERGGISVPSVSTIGSITTAISVIEEADDAAGGTFATKSCQDLACPTWTDVAVGAISHCREYGNFNARAWPEGIAHENNLTMAAHSRTAEERLLDRIKALSINVTTAVVYATTFDLIYAMARAAAGVRSRLRLSADQVQLRAMMPAWILEMIQVDIAASQFDRFKSRQDVLNILRLVGVQPSFYLDTPGTGTSQAFADETASALDDFPDDVQWALFVEGAFLHLDGGVLELGVVRDSTLNSTNDYQVFGETFENVARIGPTQGALWVTSTVCPSGEFPATTTALSCA
jgi:CBS domain-containing protein